MAGEELGRGVHHDVGAVLKRANQCGGADGVVHDHGEVVARGHLGDAAQVGDVVARVGNRLGVDRLCVGTDCTLPLCVVRSVPHVVELDAEAFEAAAEEDAGAAVDRCGRDDVVALTGEGEQRRRDRGLPTRHCDSGGAALE